MKCAIHQFNPTVGALEENATKLIASIKEAKKQGCSLFISSELSLCGYMPKDLLFRPEFHKQICKQLDRFLELKDITIIIGAPYIEANHCYNSAFIIRDGKIIGRYDKQQLPNHDVFDEHRYFISGIVPLVFEQNGIKFGVIICEDTWVKEPAELAKQAGAEVLISINASPFNIGKYQERLEIAKARVKEINLPLIYVNQLGGQDNLVFDGASFVLDETSQLIAQFPAFKQELNYCDISIHHKKPVDPTFHRERFVEFRSDLTPYPEDIESVYEALVLATRDYVTKNGFKGVLLGLSGGIDSALTLAIACDALGHDKVMAIMMPSRYTADISLTDSRDIVKRLNVKYEEIAIENIFNQFKTALSIVCHSHVDGNPATDTTEENLQARIRGTLLMALSNKGGALVLTTGNKSEMAVGYATLYGDMAGGFAVLKDVPKTLVYKLSRWRNTKSDIIPERIITRAPSAELRENQTDQDSLPDYDTLDAIIELIVEHKFSAQEIIKRGFNEADVSKVAKLIKLNEYKRSQAAVGPKITTCAFNNDWRYPITNHFHF
ncbi:MAG: synthase [Burkholderiales bacterium]|jgi:NAD+ synthase (glutamine-hydrolysing)|nr:synthase [Burkholderiales bacterium]